VVAGDLDDRPRVVGTVGVFDGVHRGHRALLGTVTRRARETGLKSLAVTFDPHPVTVLAHPAPPHLLAGRHQQLRYFAELGLDLVWMLPFSRRLAAMEPGPFVGDLLLRYADLAELWVGHDFHFGRDRAGDAAWLRRAAAGFGFEVHEFPALLDGDRPFSSRRIRDALARGEIEEAARMLGHTPLVEGRVVQGRGQGAKLLVATANLGLPDELFLPAYGVYAGWAEVGGGLFPAVANVGIRPTLVQDPRPVVEVHLLGWTGDLVGQTLGLHLGTRLRGERNFKSLDELRSAVSGDVEVAGRWLADHPFPGHAPAAGSGGDFGGLE
jgi:riboflavin kinase / FMN adenylyltransferase